MGRRQQEHARAKLRALGLIKEQLFPGLPPRLLTRLELEELAQRLVGLCADGARAISAERDSRQRSCSNVELSCASLRHSAVHESAKQQSPVAPSRNEQVRQPWVAQMCTSHMKGTTADEHHPQVPSIAESAAPGAEVVVGLLKFPPFVLPDERPLLARIVSQCPEQAQTILDELAGQAQNPARRISIDSPLAYARALTQRALTGAFIPETAVRVAAMRRRQDEEALRQQREHEERCRRDADVQDPERHAAAEAKRVECLARIRTLLTPVRSRLGLRL
jgi:hypothetical protein